MLRAAGLETKRRILSVCVPMFLEKGYRASTVHKIVADAHTSVSGFQNIFNAKDGVLIDISQAVFEGQFEAARKYVGGDLPPVYAYALETSIQLTMTEMNENLREIYVEAYSLPNTTNYINEQATAEIQKIFSSYFPDFTAANFYEMEIGSAGLMRAYMAKKCDIHFPFDIKLRRFLETSLRMYTVPEKEIQEVIDYILAQDLKTIAADVIDKLFRHLEVTFDFKLEPKENS